MPRGIVCAEPVCWPAHSTGGWGTPGRPGSFGKRPQDKCPRRELQSARCGQSLCCRWQFFLLQRGGEPCSHHHGERAPGRRPPGSKNQVKLKVKNSNLNIGTPDI